MFCNSANAFKFPTSPEASTEIDHNSIDLNHDLTYWERPICILGEDVRLTRRCKIKMYKVKWSNHTEDEATWECEDYLRREFPGLLHA
jgi:hypothetical protein